jgi:hypothetical protein
MTRQVNRRSARQIFEEIEKDLPDVKAFIPRHRDPGCTTMWQHTVRIECKKDDPDYRAVAEWCKGKGFIFQDWRDLNDHVVGLDITDIVE